jgi:hypothetical protein
MKSKSQDNKNTMKIKYKMAFPCNQRKAKFYIV